MTQFNYIVCGFVFALCVSMPALAAAQSPGAAQGLGPQDLDISREKLRFEPKVAEVVRKTLEYFRVSPENFDQLRSAARSRAALPLLATGYRFDTNSYTSFSEQITTAPNQIEANSGNNIHAFTVGAVWDLRELIFNPAEVQVYGIIGVQRDLLLEATRTYYLRRQLMLRYLLRPPDDEVAREALRLRIDEFTALLDVLTGGWFSETREERARRGQAGGNVGTGESYTPSTQRSYY